MTDFQDRLQRALATEFRIDRELGGAGMSRVFVATERALNRTVVVKVLPPDLAAGVNVERFRREIQLAAQLQHPLIVPLLATGDHQGLLWFSMPYIEGESLRGALARQGRLSPRDVVRILHDVVDALAYAHARGVVHRDIKPDNILTSGMHALVTDFGVAKALSDAIPVHGSTTTGMAIGTPAYMAPEQLAADPAADHRVDVYAVGLLAYELLTGKSPFSGTSPQATLAAQLTLVPEPPHRSFREIPEPLSQLIMHCLEKDADKRPQTAAALLAHLEALSTITGSMPAAAGSVGGRVRTRRIRPLALLSAAGLLATLIWVVRPRGGDIPSAADALEARDAGPGGDVQSRLAPPGGSVGQPATVTTSADTAAGTVVPFVITRAESLAIAEAMSRRQSAVPRARSSGDLPRSVTGTSVSAPPGPSPVRAGGTVGDTMRIAVQLANGAIAELDRTLLLEEVGRIFADSMTRAVRQLEATLATAPRFMRPDVPPETRSLPTASGTPAFDARSAPRPSTIVTPLMAPPADARVRVVVTDFTNGTGRRELSVLARNAATQLREVIPAERFDVIPADVTERTTRSLPDKMSVGWALRADYVVSGWVLARGDSVSVVTMLTDVRTGRFTRAVETVTIADVKVAGPALETARRQMRVWLDTAASITARRRAAESAKR